jgi:Fe-S oxidoreductase
MKSRTRRGRNLENFRREIYLCSRCGYCRGMVRARDTTDLVCPILENTGGFDSFTARGRNIIARGILEGKLDPKSVSPEFVDILFACTLCGSCQEHCLSLDPNTWDVFPDNKFTDHKVDVLGIAESLRGIIIEKGNPPPAIRQVLQNIQLHGNAEGRPRNKREEFLKELDFRVKKAGEGKCDTLLYAGSVASYNQRDQKIVQAIARVLHVSNVDFCVLGNEEEDSGSDALRLGEEGLFEELAQRNLALFKKYGVKNIVCVSPHDYDSFVNDYPAYLEDEWSKLKVKLQHYTEFLAELVRSGKLKIRKRLGKTVVFQDPCYLGRINGVFDAPREVIKATGAEMVEMRCSRRNSYCCGGGGGGVWYEALHKPRLQTQRAKQACETGADILAVACPICAQMLEEGLTSLEKCEMKVLDVAEILLEAMN